MLTLPPVVSLLTVLLMIPGALWYGRHLYRRGITFTRKTSVREMPLIPVLVLLYIACVVAGNLIIAHPQWGWYMPLAVEYYTLPALWVFRIIFLAFALFTGVALAWLSRRPLGVTLACVTLAILVLSDGLSRYVSQPFLGDFRRSVKDGVILQSTASTCAAASCANIATQLGLPKTEEEMAAQLHTTWNGTFPAQMVYGMRALGFEATKKNVPDCDIRKVTPPAVLLVAVGGEFDSHAVAFMGMVEGNAEIWDPVGGKRNDKPEDLAERWGGHAIEIGKR